MKIGITGQPGFIGTHLYNYLSLTPDKYTLVPFRDDFFDAPEKLAAFVSGCDFIVHLAAVNRHHDPDEIYSKNIELVDKLIAALKESKSKAHVIFSSSTQEERENIYGRSKREGRLILSAWARENASGFTGLIIPNVFGPFGRPYYNSVIATFSHQLTNGESPKIEIDAELSLIYVGELVKVIEEVILNKQGQIDEGYCVDHTSKIKVTDILKKLEYYRDNYFNNGIIPLLETSFDINLFNTFRSYMDLEKFFPRKYKLNKDERGVFVETMKLNVGGQVSYSTTVPGITRGNHFHTRKIERFAVVKGEALIQLRRIDQDKVINLYLSGNEPAYVDMPVWYTHNIKNIGTEEVVTMFWINEFYDPADPDTFFQQV